MAKFLTNVDLNKNQLLNALLQNLASHPSTPSDGQVYYNTTDETVYLYTSGGWLDLTSGTAMTGDEIVTAINASSSNIDDDNLSSTTQTRLTKVDGIENSADVTDADNIASSITGSSSKTTPVDADTVPLIDSEASSILKYLSFTNIKAFLKTYFDTLYASAGTYAGKYTTAIGDGSSTDIVVTHSLGTQDVVVAIRETASPYAQVMADIENTSTSTITLTFATAPTSSEYTVTVIG